MRPWVDSPNRGWKVLSWDVFIPVVVLQKVGCFVRLIAFQSQNSPVNVICHTSMRNCHSKIFQLQTCYEGECFFNPWSLKIKIWILICCPYSFPSGEKLIKYQANSSCVIMSVILMTTLFYKALILQGEIWCWSLLGFKGLRVLYLSDGLLFLSFGEQVLVV